MKQYLDMLNHILNEGERVSNRTGVDTISVFGYQTRFNLREGFPLLTTKKMFTKGIIHELLWFLRGDTNVKYLQDNGVHIWDSWCDENGYLGPVYGKQWTRWEDIKYVAPRIFQHHNLKADLSLACGFGYPGNPDKFDPHYHKLLGIWEGMLQRCYNSKRKEYLYYGAKGVHVDPSWHCFETFQKEVKLLPGWNSYVANSWLYSLDKDYYSSNRYSLETCMWALPTQQRINTGRNKAILAEHESGIKELTLNLSRFATDRALDISSLYACVRGTRKTYNGWKFSIVTPPAGTIPRIRIINQIHEVIGRIKSTPQCRRQIVSAWNPLEIDKVQLPPCHTLFQFKVTHGNRLSCQLYQRSADCFLGVPFNIASYALLTHMVAQVTGLEVGEFIHTFGDLHIYVNHLSQVTEQLSRDPMPLPKLWLNPEVKNIDDFKFEDIRVEGYQSHPAIKGEVAV